MCSPLLLLFFNISLVYASEMMQGFKGAFSSHNYECHWWTATDWKDLREIQESQGIKVSHEFVTLRAEGAIGYTSHVVKRASFRIDDSDNEGLQSRPRYLSILYVSSMIAPVRGSRIVAGVHAECPLWIAGVDFDSEGLISLPPSSSCERVTRKVTTTLGYPGSRSPLDGLILFNSGFTLGPGTVCGQFMGRPALLKEWRSLKHSSLVLDLSYLVTAEHALSYRQMDVELLSLIRGSPQEEQFRFERCASVVVLTGDHGVKWTVVTRGSCPEEEWERFKGALVPKRSDVSDEREWSLLESAAERTRRFFNDQNVRGSLRSAPSPLSTQEAPFRRLKVARRNSSMFAPKLDSSPSVDTYASSSLRSKLVSSGGDGTEVSTYTGSSLRRSAAQGGSKPRRPTEGRRGGKLPFRDVPAGSGLALALERWRKEVRELSPQGPLRPLREEDVALFCSAEAGISSMLCSPFVSDRVGSYAYKMGAELCAALEDPSEGRSASKDGGSEGRRMPERKAPSLEKEKVARVKRLIERLRKWKGKGSSLVEIETNNRSGGFFLIAALGDGEVEDEQKRSMERELISLLTPLVFSLDDRDEFFLSSPYISFPFVGPVATLVEPRVLEMLIFPFVGGTGVLLGILVLRCLHGGGWKESQ